MNSECVVVNYSFKSLILADLLCWLLISLGFGHNEDWINAVVTGKSMRR